MFKRLKVRTLLAASLALLAVEIGLIGVGGMFGIRVTNAALADSAGNVPTVIALLGAQENLQHARLILDRLAAMTDAANADVNLLAVDSYVRASDQHWATYQAFPAGAEERQLAAAVSDRRTRLMEEGIRPAEAALRASDQEAARKITFSIIPSLSVALGKATEQLREFQVRDSAALVERGRIHERALLAFNATLLVVGLVLAFGAWWVLRRSISKPLANALSLFGSIESGDLTGRVEVAREDEFGVLMRSLDAMQKGLRGTVSTIRDGVVGIAESATEIASGSNDLSRRTEEQAASLEQTASSLEQLTATVQQNAEHLREASTLSQEMRESAATNATSVRRLAEDMKELKNGSDQIADITAIIEGIAFQTNILALNASVEAARAGEQGKGFAVVASEVRALAQRSAVAAKEIKDLINSSIQRVDSGATQAINAAARVDSVVTSINRVTALLEEISSASQEQAKGLQQIVTVVSQMDGVTQQNAALVEQAAAASESLNAQAQAIRSSVDKFRISNA